MKQSNSVKIRNVIQNKNGIFSPIRLTNVRTDNIQGQQECSKLDSAVHLWEDNSAK